MIDKCAACDGPLGHKVVEMRSYGLKFHPECFVKTTGPEMIRLMGDDETIVRTKGQEESHRVRDPRYVQADGSVRGPREMVTW